MWYKGWGIVKHWGPNEIMVGFRNVVIKYSYPKDADDVKNAVGKYRTFLSTVPNTLFESMDSYVRSLPKVKWLDQHLVNMTLPLISADVKLTYGQVLSFVKPRIVDFINRNSQNPELSKDLKEHNIRLDDTDLYWALDRAKMTDKLGLSIPVFAKDVIYVLFTGAYKLNRDDETEITYRFFDESGSLQIPMNFNLNSRGFALTSPTPVINGGWNNNLPHLSEFGINAGSIGVVIQGSPSSAELISGEFYAAAYGGGWVGFNLKWER